MSNINIETNSHIDAIERKEEVPLLSLTPPGHKNIATKNNTGQ